MKALTLLIFATLSTHAFALTTSSLMIRGYVPKTFSTKVIQKNLSSTKSLITFQTSMNSEHLNEGQKFEVEGLENSGREGVLTRVSGTSRMIQYDLLVNQQQKSMPVNKPIYLKISAN